MKIIKATANLIAPPSYDELLWRVENAGRTCYKSEGKATDTSAEPFVRNIIKRGHEAVLEHGSLSARFICDRGVTHEIVRHRLAAYCQESTRYCNYANKQFNSEITVIEPYFFGKGTPIYRMWQKACENAETAYFDLLNEGCSPQEARSVLPNSLKTEIVMTANLREWRHFFKLRCATAAHPQMREVALQLLDECKKLYPVFFEDIEVE